MALRRFIIERDIPEVGGFGPSQMREAAGVSNRALSELGAKIQWAHSYVAGDKTFCVYLAENEEIIRKHSDLSGFPATKITEIHRMIDPTTERAG